MTEQEAGLLIVFLIFVGFFGFVFIGSRMAGRKEEENFKKLEDKFSSSTRSIDNGRYGSPGGHLLEGKHEGMFFVCYTYMTGSGKSSAFFTEFKISHQLNSKYSLRLYNEYLFHKIGKSTSMVEELEIGDANFDKQFLIQSEDKGITQAILKKSIRDKLMAIPKRYYGEITIGRSTIVYKAGNHLSNDTEYRYFEEGLDATLLLLDELKRVVG